MPRLRRRLSPGLMIIHTSTGETYDTDADLEPAERHVLQKLFLWQAMSVSLEQFREKKKQALEKGWNNSGPVSESKALKAIIAELERTLTQRLEELD